jgi:hypothetical protein
MGLCDQFKKAGLVLRLLEEPMRTNRGMDRIVQIDIGRGLKGNTRREWFRMYVPDGAMVQVRNTDKAKSQLVLLVKEGKHSFEEELTFMRWRNPNFEEWIERLKGQGTRVKKIFRPGTKGHRSGGCVVEHTTDPQTRYFLMGVDERQLFIAQLTGPATTVREAHNMLGSTVEFADGKRKGSKMDRQGEWFFLETTQEARDEIERRIKAHAVVHRNTSIGARTGRSVGNPHTADELIQLEGIPLEHGWPIRDPRTFVRGKVRHVDHKTVKFKHWREVVANNEGATAQATASGVAWVD